jgi:DNA-binding NtrC family response regulator
MTRDEPSLRMLVVDDEALIRWAVVETLMQAGHQVVEACDGGSALRALKDAEEHVDVVLLDLRLPDCADLTLLSRIRHQSPHSAVVMMTAHATPELIAEARALGVYDVLAKPFDVNGCERILRQAHSATTRH